MKRRGSVLTEFVLVAGVFFALLLGIVDWSVSFYVHETLAHRALVGARTAAISGTMSDASDIVRCGSVGCGSSADLPSLAGATISVQQVSVEDTNVMNGSGLAMRTHVIVTVSNYTISQVAPFVGLTYKGQAIRAAEPMEPVDLGG
jgi:Flp pilus assembly protein TadG